MSTIPNFPYTRDARLKTRYEVIRLFLEVKNRTVVAKTTRVSRRLVNEWVTAYLSDGLKALNIKKQSGRPCGLTLKQKCQLKDYICAHAVKEEGGRLIGEDIRKYIYDIFGVQYKLNNVYRLMCELNLSWITSRSKHPKQSIEAQEDLKNFYYNTIITIPCHVALDRVDVWFQDEARFGQQNTPSKIWANTNLLGCGIYFYDKKLLYN